MQFQFTHPGKGATILNCPMIGLNGSFNSRTLGRVRRYPRLGWFSHGWFQFTHPGKGATGNVGKAIKLLFVSIHAPWEGCDLHGVLHLVRFPSFNSRTLGRVRPTDTSLAEDPAGVSIHAPWEGCDLSQTVTIPLLVCFNSRTLGRVRLVYNLIYFAAKVSFNSRTLGRVRLGKISN